MRRVALYLRVSTGSETVGNQELELTAAAQRHDWSIKVPNGPLEDGDPIGSYGMYNLTRAKDILKNYSSYIVSMKRSEGMAGNSLAAGLHSKPSTAHRMGLQSF